VVEIDSGGSSTEIWYTQLGKTAYLNGTAFNYAYWPTPGGGTLLQTHGSGGDSYYYEHNDWLGNARISSTLGTIIIHDRAFAPLRGDVRQLRLRFALTLLNVGDASPVRIQMDCEVGLRPSTFPLNNQDPEMQFTELREYAGRPGWQIVEEFTDQGVSGCKESRPALNRLMSDACRRRFDAILVWKIDRFGRSLKHLVNALADLAALVVAFVSLRDNLDLSTPSGRLMFQIIGAMAEFERALILERVRAGLRNARVKGRRLGRPRVFVDASQIASLRLQGRSWAQITEQIGVSKERRNEPL
jgi:DNA invertase Pin-like site-specific DNA recombinase